MVSVMVVRPFTHLGHDVSGGEWVELEALDAAVKAQAGLVSLSHGQTYQTRDMVAAAPVQVVPVESRSTLAVPVDLEAETLPKRRRGRPRKARE